MSADGEDVKLRWSCGHEGHLNIDWLRKHCYAPHTLQKAMKDGMPNISALVGSGIH